jgi:beta-galactosidase
MDKTTFYHQRANLDNPDLRAYAEVYLEKVVGRYKDHPAAGEWLLMNEPTKYHEDADTFKAFGKWLKNKYGTVEAINKVYFRPIESFDEVVVSERSDSHNYWLDEEEYLDWKQFNVDNLIANLAWIQSKVLALDAKHPTHFNVTRPVGDSVGQDVWKEARLPDTIGVSMHWTMTPTTPERDYGEGYADRLDQVAGASFAEPGKPFWVTELQSGPAITLGVFRLFITPQLLTRWMWDSYGAGANAVVFWLWHPRDIGTEAGEDGVVGLEGQPTERLPVVRALAEVLDKNPSLANQHPQQARVAILWDRDAALINDLDGKWQTHRPGEDRRSEDVGNALAGCHLALMRAHIPLQYVDTDQLKRGEVNKFPVLYAPMDYAMDDATIAALKEYVKQGGTLWADGITAWKNEHGKIRPTIPGGLTDLFGVEAVEINAIQPSHPYSVTPANELGGELWKLPAEVKGGTVVQKDADGNPFEVKNTYGKGNVTYFTSAVTLAYHRRENPIVHQWILEPALKQAAEMPIQLKKGSDHLLFRGLTGASGSTAILTNWGETQTATVLFKGVHKVKNVMTGQEVPVTSEGGNTLATLSVAAGTDAVLMTE